jgi:hypothetical protein
MSTYYGLRKSIKADELFDGRLEVFGVYEEGRPEGAADRFPAYRKVKEVRYLTDGRDSMKVVIYESGVADLNVRNLWCAREREILHAIAEAFGTGIVSEHEPQYWGFDTQEEWDEWEKQRSREDEESFHNELLKCLRGEPSDIWPGTIGMIKAEIAKKLTDKEPGLLMPTNKDKLRKEIDTIYDSEHAVIVTLGPGDIAAAEMLVSHKDDLPRG